MKEPRFHKLRKQLQTLAPKSVTIRAISVLATGAGVAQLISLLASPILTRLYSPGDFGIYSLYSAILAILLGFTSLSYQRALPLPKVTKHAFYILVLSFIVHISLCVLLLAVIFFKGDHLLELFNWTSLQPYTWMIPAGFAGGGTYLILNYWAVREKAFGTIAKTKVTQSFSGKLSQIFLGFIGMTPSGLLIGQIINQTAGVTTLAKLLPRSQISWPNPKKLITVAKRYRHFPLYTSWGSLLNTASAQITPLLLVSWYSESVAGWFALGFRLIHLPIGLLGTSVSQVFFQRASEARFSGETNKVTMRFFKALTLLGTFPLLGIAIIAPNLFSLLFGHEWANSGVYVRLLAPYLVFQTISSPISNIFLTMEKQRLLVLFQSLLLATRVLSLWAGQLLGSPTASIAFYGIASAFAYLLYLIMILKVAGCKLSDVLAFFTRVFVLSVLYLLPTLFFQIRNMNYFTYGSIILATILFTLSYKANVFGIRE